MLEFFYNRRFTVFLFSFLVMLFGNTFFPVSIRQEVEMVLLLQNMFFSYLLFLRESKKERRMIASIIFLGFITRLNQQEMVLNSPFLFAGVYVVYFGLISFRLFHDLRKQKVVGLETISAVFAGFILLGVVASIIFVSLDKAIVGAFAGPIETRDFSDFLYFSFITLLTIGYGDITPTLEVSKKIVIIVGLLGHFYTVFVTAIIIGKYLSLRKGTRE